MKNRSRAHCARLQSCVNRAAGQAIIADGIKGASQGGNFRMRRAVFVCDGAIHSFADYFSVGIGDDRPHRHFAFVKRLLSKSERAPHQRFGKVILPPPLLMKRIR